MSDRPTEAKSEGPATADYELVYVTCAHCRAWFTVHAKDKHVQRLCSRSCWQARVFG